jgi:hypothetical protein
MFFTDINSRPITLTVTVMSPKTKMPNMHAMTTHSVTMRGMLMSVVAAEVELFFRFVSRRRTSSLQYREPPLDFCSLPGLLCSDSVVPCRSVVDVWSAAEE